LLDACRRYFVRSFEHRDLRASKPLELIGQLYASEAASKAAGEWPHERLLRRQRLAKPVMYGNSIALILHEVRRWRARGRHVRSWETIGWAVVVGGRDEPAVTRGVERGVGRRGRRSEEAAVAAAASVKRGKTG
jgi:hypothetical protein